MPALIDTLLLGRLRARAGRWSWIAGALAGLSAGVAVGIDGAGAVVACLGVGLLVGWIVGALLIASVRCPSCGHRLLWAHYDDDTGLEPDPLEATACPRCGYRHPDAET